MSTGFGNGQFITRCVTCKEHKPNSVPTNWKLGRPGCSSLNTALVDWNKGLVVQVGDLGEDYAKWTSLPVDREMKFFDNPVLEWLTQTSLSQALGFWMSVIAGFFAYGTHSLGTIFDVRVPFFFMLGMFLWTPLEYLVHRYVFHAKIGAGKVKITLHFLLHGNHHKNPYGKHRVLTSPLLAIIVTFPVYKIFVALLPFGCSQLTYAGMMTLYTLYELVHYSVHQTKSNPGSIFHDIKRNHIYHHFVNDDQGFGVTSPIWDKIFGTKPHR